MICCSMQSSKYMRLDHQLEPKNFRTGKMDDICVEYIDPMKIDSELRNFFLLKMKFARAQQILRNKGKLLEICKNVEFWLNSDMKALNKLLPYFYQEMEESAKFKLARLKESYSPALFKQLEMDLLKSFLVLKAYEIIKIRRNN